MPTYICPITQGTPQVPVITNDTHTYDFIHLGRNNPTGHLILTDS